MADENTNSSIDKTQLKAILAPIIASLGISTLASAVMSKVAVYTASNLKTSDPTGDHDRHPTKTEANLAEQKANGATQDKHMAKDDVALQHGEVAATENTADANTSEATASEAGATASRVKAGASDVETKGLKVM